MKNNLTKQSCTFLSTYTADVSGICSALYELGGMVVMHDASGCNSTYNTHDEPRWYQMDSMIYISALTELDAMLGNDDKLVNDICKAADELKPRFIAVCGSPIPMVAGTDFPGIAKMIERQTGIPTFGFPTNGMHSYLSGIDMAFSAFARRFCTKREETLENKLPGSSKPQINLLGVTPLDFSINGNVKAMKNIFESNGFHVRSCFAMGCNMEELNGAGYADVNVIVSSCAISAARYLEEEFGTPYVVGIPMGNCLTKVLFSSIIEAGKKRENQYPVLEIPGNTMEESGNASHPTGLPKKDRNVNDSSVYIIGEPVFATSLKYTLFYEFGYNNVTVVSPLEADEVFLSENDSYMPYECDIREKLKDAKIVIADPLYRRIIGNASDTLFINFPHEAYSGRIYRDEIPVFIGDQLIDWLKDRLKYNG